MILKSDHYSNPKTLFFFFGDLVLRILVTKKTFRWMDCIESREIYNFRKI